MALALGGLSTGVSPLQMARAYSVFANKGNLPNNAYFITKIEDASSNVIAQNSNIGNHRIMSQSVAKEVTSMLLGIFTSGTAQSAQPAGYEVANKTGSIKVSWAYGTKDQWIVGYTPDVVVATWVGFDKTDQNHYMQGISETGTTRLHKAEMEGILPYTKGIAFSEKPAQSMANATGSNSDWLSQARQNLQNGSNQAGKDIQKWYNNIKGLFGR